MSIIIKIYQSKLISEVLAARSNPEVKDGIDKTFSSLKKQNICHNQVLKLAAQTLNELKTLNQSKLSHEQHANIITAKLHLEQLKLQITNTINCTA